MVNQNKEGTLASSQLSSGLRMATVQPLSTVGSPAVVR